MHWAMADVNMVAGQGFHRRGGSLYCMHDASAWIWAMGGAQVRDPKVVELPLRLVHQGELDRARERDHTFAEHTLCFCSSAQFLSVTIPPKE